MSKFFDRLFSEVGAEAKRLGTLGRAEMANGLYTGQAFTMYGPGQEPVNGRTPQVQRFEPEHDQGMER